MADVSGILAGVQQPPPNPLQIISGWQDYANKVAQNAQIKAVTANTQQQTSASQQEQAIQGAIRHSQEMASILALPDAQIPGAAAQKLQAELSTGQISQSQYEAGKQMVDAAIQTGNVGQLKTIAAQHILSTLSGEQQMGALTPHVHDTEIGGQIVPRTTPSAMALLQNPNAGIATSPGAIDRTLAPGYQNVGNQILPVGGALGSPVLNAGVSPETAAQINTIIDPNTGQPVTGRNFQQGGLPQGGYAGVGPAVGGVAGPSGGTVTPNQAPPVGGFRLPGAGVQTAQPGTVMGTGGPAVAGLLGKGPITTNPQAIEAQGLNFKNFREALDAQPTLKTTEQTLLRIDEELRATPTGPGTDSLQKLRNYVSSLNGVMGGKINTNDIAAGSYDELSKDLNQLVASAGGGAKFAGNVDAIIHGNPNMMMSRLANANVTALFLGKNRQQQLEVALTKDQTSGRDFQQARNQVQNLDPRALALDVMTPQMRSETLKELQGNAEASRKFFRTLAVAKQHGVFNTGPGMAPPSNALQGAPANALQGQ